MDQDYVPENKYLEITFDEMKPKWHDFLSLSKKVIEKCANEESYFEDVSYITIGFDDGDLEVIRINL